MKRRLHALLGAALFAACGPAPVDDQATGDELQEGARIARAEASGAPYSTTTDFANLSTRLYVGTGNDVGITGFVIAGTGLKRVIIRALGPSLTPFGVPGVVANPTLELHNASGAIIASNDDWQWDSKWTAVAGSGLAPSSPLEAALAIDLAPGAYTAIVRGAAGGTGVALVELYDRDPVGARRLINLSTRGDVLTGDRVMIGGFVIQGTQPLNVLIRGIGPSLVAAGIPNALANPTIRLVNAAGATLATNDDWNTNANAGAIVATGFAPTNSLESAILTQLSPGAYTVIVSGTGPSPTGVGLVELYEIPLVRFAGCSFSAAGSGQTCLNTGLLNPPMLYQYVGCLTADGGATCSTNGSAPYSVVTQPPSSNSSCPASPYLVISPGGYCACPAGTLDARGTQTGVFDGTVDCYR